MCKISIYLVILTSLLSIVECNASDVTRNVTKARASDENDNLLSRVVGVPGVWWPVTQIVTNAWSLFAAGISATVVGASLLPQLRRSDQVSERIYRGVVAKPNSWPWIAKLKTTFKRPGAKTRRRACGGALISDRFILTARHCVSWDHNGVVVDGRQVQVWLGSHGREGQDGFGIPVKRIIIRPDYQQPQCASGLWCPDWAPWGHTTLTNDIAIIELMRSAPKYAHITPIKLANFSPPPGTLSWVGGWGLDGYRPTKILNIAPMAVQKDSFRECKQQLSPGKMCVIGKDFGGPCPGDSGSPLVTYSKKNGPELIGLVSNGAESCKAGLPGIFTRVSYYYDWIHVAMQTARRVGSSDRYYNHRNIPRHWDSQTHYYNDQKYNRRRPYSRPQSLHETGYSKYRRYF